MQRLKVTQSNNPGSIGYLAGIQIGDILDTYDGKPLDKLDTLVKIVSEVTEGLHTIRLFRKDSFLELQCAAGKLGLVVEEFTVDFDVFQNALSVYEKTNLAELKEKIDGIILTTAPSIDGFNSEVIDVITAECVFGMNIFIDFASSLTDVFGGRSKSMQKVLFDTRKTCLNELKKEAFSLGGDAVIAIDLDYSEFSGGGKSMLFLVASGTAVKLKKIANF